MYDRELTQLISAAQYYLDAAESLHVPDHELARTVSADSDRWSADRLPHPLRSSTSTRPTSRAAPRGWQPSRRFSSATQRKRGPAHTRILRTSRATTSVRRPHERSRSFYVTTWAMPSTTPKETREPPFAGLHWPSSRSGRWGASFGVGIRRLREDCVEARMPNTPFHLTPSLAPSGRSVRRR